MKTSNYLDRAINKLKFHSDNELARHMKWSKSQVNNYRHERQAMDNKQALKIAEVLEVPVLKVIADMELQRAEKNDDIESIEKWTKLSKMAGNISTKLLITLPFLSSLVLYTVYYVK